MIIIAGSPSFDPSDREDVEVPNTFRFFECWGSQALLDAHLAAPHEAASGERNLRRITGATASFFEASPAEVRGLSAAD
jgi:quinol monooxygenase YgiN